MTKQEKMEIITHLNHFAEKALKDIDLLRTPISEQLDYLKPEMIMLAEKYKVETTDIFVIYMDNADSILPNIKKDIDNLEVDEDDLEFQDYLADSSFTE